MQKLDGEIEEVNGWIDGAEKKMYEMDSQGPNDGVLKVVMDMYFVFNLQGVQKSAVYLMYCFSW